MEFGYIINIHKSRMEQTSMNKGIQLGVGVKSNNSKDSNKFDSFLKNTKNFIAFTLAEILLGSL